MFCKQCGAQMEPNVRFCGTCGDVVEQAEANQNAPTSTKAKISNKHIGMIACGVIVVVLAIVLVSMFSGRGPERVLGRYISAMGDFDLQAMSRHSVFDIDTVVRQALAAEGMSTRDFNNLLYEMYGVRSLDALFSEVADAEREWLREDFGRNYRITHEIVDSFEFSSREMRDEIEDMEDFLNRRFGFGLDDFVRVDRINEMVEFVVDVTIRGSLDSDTERMDIIMVRVGREWLVWDEEILFGW